MAKLVELGAEPVGVEGACGGDELALMGLDRVADRRIAMGVSQQRGVFVGELARGQTVAHQRESGELLGRLGPPGALTRRGVGAVGHIAAQVS